MGRKDGGGGGGEGDGWCGLGGRVSEMKEEGIRRGDTMHELPSAHVHGDWLVPQRTSSIPNSVRI